MKKDNVNLTEGPLLTKILLFSLPLMLTGILQLLYSAADLVVVGQFVGKESMGAVGACNALINLIIGSCMGLSVGVGIAVAQDIGAGAFDRLDRLMRTSLILGLVSGIVVAGFGYFLSEDLLILMKTPKELLPEATRYMRAYFWGVPGAMVYNYLASALRSSGDTKRPLLFLTLSGIVNVVLNLITVIVFEMGAMGVGIATTVSQYAAVVMILVYMIRTKEVCRLTFGGDRGGSADVRRILHMGIPSCIQSMCFSLSNVVIQSTINKFGEIAVDGSSAAANIDGFLYICLYSFVQAAIVFAGQSVGARKYDRLKPILRDCIFCTVVFGILVAALILVFDRILLGFYAPGEDAVIEAGIIRLWIVCPVYFLYGVMAVISGMLQGMGRPVLTMLLTLAGTCVFRLFWIWQLNLLFPNCYEDEKNIIWLFLCYPVSWVVTLVAQYIAYHAAKRKILGEL